MATQKIQKAVGAIAVGAVTILGSAMTAFGDAANGWDSNILDSAVNNTGVNAGNIDAGTISNFVQTFTTWILGIAIVLFVLRVVLTAINKMFFDSTKGSGGRGAHRGGGSLLEAIPIVGAYPTDMEWKQVWIEFGKNVGIVVGAWIIVQFLCSAIKFVFSAVVSKSNVTG